MKPNERAIELYREKLSIYEIARELGCAPQTVSKWLIKADEPRRSKAEGTQIAFEKSGRGHETRIRRQEIKDQREQRTAERQYAVTLYCGGRSAASIGRELGRPTKTITDWVKKSGYSIRPLTIACRTQTLREDAFSVIETDAQVYWLGFITADGGVSDSDELRINLQLRDKPHLERLREFLGASYQVGEYHIGKMKNGEWYERHSAYLQVLSHPLCADLRKHGIEPRKSETTKFNQDLPDHLYGAYLRGLFDGDGGWSSLIGPGQAQWHLKGNREFLFDLQTKMMFLIGVNRTVLGRHHSTVWLRNLCYGGIPQALRICQFMYAGATMFLPRKIATFVEFLDRFEPSRDYNFLKQLLAEKLS